MPTAIGDTAGQNTLFANLNTALSGSKSQADDPFYGRVMVRYVSA